MPRRTPLPTVLADRYQREVAKLYRARAAVTRAEDRLFKIAKASAPLDAKVPEYLRHRYETEIRSLIYGEGMGPDYDTLPAFTSHLRAITLPSILADAAE